MFTSFLHCIGIGLTVLLLMYGFCSVVRRAQRSEDATEGE